MCQTADGQEMSAQTLLTEIFRRPCVCVAEGGREKEGRRGKGRKDGWMEEGGSRREGKREGIRREG